MSDQTYQSRRSFDVEQAGVEQSGTAPGRSSGLVSSLIATARDNPIAATLVSMGVVYWFAGSPLRRGAETPATVDRALRLGGAMMTDMARSAGDAIGRASGTVASAGESAARQAADFVASGARSASEAVNSGAERLGDLAGSVGETLRTTGSQSLAAFSSNARSQMGQLLNDQPLLLAAGAFAVGVAMAASLPLTEAEDRVLGDVAEKALRPGETAEAIGARLQNAAAAAKEEARRQGLTPDALQKDVAALRDRAAGAISGAKGANAPPA